MVVNFNKIDIEGFLSIGKSTVDLIDLGVVLVDGVNNSPEGPSSNGAGKSTIFEAIYYVFTGNTIRGTTDVVNKYYKEEDYCLVSLDFQVDSDRYIVTRTRTKNHKTYDNNLKIIKNDIDISGDKLRKSEQILENELPSITANLLTSVVIISQGMSNKFTSLKPTARKERLEELSQCSDFINQLKSRISAKSKETTEETNKLNNKKAGLDAKLGMLRRSIEKKTEEIKNLENQEDSESLRNDISKYERSIQEQVAKRNEAHSTTALLKSDLAKLRKDIDNAQKKETKLSTEISSLTSKVKELAVSTCPTCEQVIQSPDTVTNLKNTYFTKITKLEEELSKTKECYKELTNKEKKLDDECNKVEEKRISSITLISDYKAEIRVLETKLRNSSAIGDLIKSDIDSLEEEVLEATKDLEELADEILKVSTKSSMLDYLGKIANKEFRSYLLEGVIDYLNLRVTYYSEKLFKNNRLSLSKKDDTKIYVTYDDRPYENLSGGERQRADLAVQFAIRDMLKNSIGFTTNLLVIDEGFDNLDTTGVDALINLLSDFDDISSIFVVTHHSELPIPYDKRIRVEKDLDKVSSIVSAGE